MATIHEFDTVTLRQPDGRGLAGTTGSALIELVVPDGASLDLLTVPLG